VHDNYTLRNNLRSENHLYVYVWVSNVMKTIPGEQTMEWGRRHFWSSCSCTFLFC